jgi:putative endonuclease
LAADYLTQKGYSILERNARTAHGEIDLVAEYNQVFVFVEVKTRTSRRYDYQEESITQRKITHLMSSAQAYLQAHPQFDGDWRIDVLAIERITGEDQPVIMHFENAVRDY